MDRHGCGLLQFQLPQRSELSQTRSASCTVVYFCSDVALQLVSITSLWVRRVQFRDYLMVLRNKRSRSLGEVAREQKFYVGFLLRPSRSADFSATLATDFSTTQATQS